MFLFFLATNVIYSVKIFKHFLEMFSINPLLHIFRYFLHSSLPNMTGQLNIPTKLKSITNSFLVFILYSIVLSNSDAGFQWIYRARASIAPLTNFFTIITVHNPDRLRYRDYIHPSVDALNSIKAQTEITNSLNYHRFK